ncbi:MAG: transposase [Saprospiraceae bacterium]|nr:transposase [Candidatus Brachybacter algidus]
MKKEQGITIRYSISFKQKVVREFEDEGLSIAQLSRRYKIKGGGTVKNWVIKYGNNDLLNKIVRIEIATGMDGRLMKHIGGKKLYEQLKDEIAKMEGPKIGRDKFFDILRERHLLVKRKRNYAKTTDSYHRFHTYENARRI